MHHLHAVRLVLTTSRPRAQHLPQLLICLHAHASGLKLRTMLSRLLCQQVSMANSSWTAEHVRRLFLSWAPPVRVYPPCDTADLAALPLERKLKRLYIVSLAQVPAVRPQCHST